MIQLSSYVLTSEFCRDMEAILYHGYRCNDLTPVVAKLLKNEHAHPKELARLRHEYAITKELDLNGVAKSFELERYGSRLALIMENFDGKPLSEVMTAKKLDLKTRLEIAVALADILES